LSNKKLSTKNKHSIKNNVYSGICLDYACGLGFCAEHAAVAEMLKHRETQIVKIVAVNKERILSPCGVVEN
jgi:cytidine deaminase